MKRHAWSRMLTAILTVAMLVSVWAAPVSARTFDDTGTHWAAETIDKWSDYKVLEGTGNNLFEPDRAMTVGEAAKVVSTLMGYSKEAENKFSDVPEGAWYESYILCMAEAGLLPSSGSVRPEQAITRGEIFTMLAKAFSLAPKTGETTFDADAVIPAEQKPYIKALQDAGKLNGRVADGKTVAAAEGSLSRAELTAMLDRLAGDQFKTITILSFNDFHGALDKTVSTSNPGADRFVGFVKNEMAKDPENTLLLVAGDNYQGSALSNLNLGKPVTDMINSLGLKYSAVGNHEFDWGSNLIKTWAEDGNFKFLCANIIETATGNAPDFCQPYATETVNGVKIGIIGFITQETPTLVKASNVAGLEFRDPAPIATTLSEKLRNEEHCDIVIALTHLGATQATVGVSEVKGEAAKLAESINPGTLDAIITGHTHTKVAGVVNGTPLVQGYYNGRGLGKLEFTLRNGVLKSVTPTYMDVDKDYSVPDADMTVKIADYNTKLAPTLNEVVGTGGPFPTKDDLANWAGDLIFNYVKRTTGNDYVVIQNDGGWRSGTFGADSPKDNKVTMGYLFTLMPFDNEIVLIDEMSGTDLLEILNQKKADGTSIEFTSKPDINGASKIGEDWYLADGTTKIVADGKYKVICNDFMLTGGDKYSQFVPYSKDPSTYKFIGTPLRDAMADQLKYEAARPKTTSYVLAPAA